MRYLAREDDGSDRAHSGRVSPRPTGTVSPRPTGTVSPRPTGTVSPRPTGTVSPLPTVRPPRQQAVRDRSRASQPSPSELNAQQQHQMSQQHVQTKQTQRRRVSPERPSPRSEQTRRARMRDETTPPGGREASCTYVNPAGVLILSERDAEALEGVVDPYVRYLLLEKAAKSVAKGTSREPSPTRTAAS